MPPFWLERTRGRLPRALSATAAAPLLWPSPAHAAAPLAFAGPMSSMSAMALAAAALSMAAAGALFFSLRRAGRNNAALRETIDDLERRLSETEVLLASDPHAMIVWEHGSDEPARVSARLQLVPGVPRDEQALPRFEEWLSGESAQRLRAALQQLRASGQPFNFSIHTSAGELLEADGRASGYTAVLRFRPVAGERREIMEATSEAHRMMRQVERLSGLLDSAPMPVWLHDRDGKLIWANAAWLRAVDLDEGGLEAAIAAGMQLIKPSQLELAREDEQSGGKVYRGATVIGGQQRILEVYESPLEDGFALWAIDITAAEQLRREMRSHIEAHTSTLDRLYSAIAIFAANGRLLFANQAFARLWDLDPDWLARRPAFAEILARLRDQRRLPETADFHAWRNAQLEKFTSPQGAQEKWHLPDGRSLHVISEPHPQGGIVFIFEDITEKLRLESRYKALMGVQRETLDNLHEAVALFGTDGRLRLFNPAFARFWGLDEKLLESAPHVDAIIRAARARGGDDDWWDAFRYSVTGMSDARKAFARRINLDDGRVYDSVMVPLPDGNTLFTWHDMSDSARVEKALRERTEALMQADELKSNFLSSVSYELRTPLNSIIGFTEILQMGSIAEPLQPRQGEYVRDIYASSTELLGAIDTILDLSTIDAGLMELRVEELDLAAIMEELAGRMQSRLERRDLLLEVELADDAATISADRHRLAQILSNLLSNAINFSTRGGVIRMGARRAGDKVELWIADQGIGMDENAINSALQRFSASGSSGGGSRGPGLGLPLAKALVELHGGAMDIISRPGEGTTVICRLPRHPQAEGKGGNSGKDPDGVRENGREGGPDTEPDGRRAEAS